MAKKDITGTRHILPFRNLSPADFERMTFWIIENSGQFDNVSYYAMKGDKQRDIVGYKHKTGGKREKWYFQCKRYQTISTAIFKVELTKIKEHGKQLPKFLPDCIVFVTGCPVSAATKDAIETYAEEQSLGPVYFWTDVELDQKAKAQPAVLEEFFHRDNVLIHDHVLGRNVSELNQKMDLALKSKRKAASPIITDWIKQVQEANPNFTIEVTHTSEGIRHTIGAKPGAGPVRFGDLVFPDTDAGKQGLAKVRNAIEEGRDFSLVPGEYDWRSALKIPFQLTTEIQPAGFQAQAHVLSKPVPVRLEHRRGGTVVASIGYTTLQLARMGTKETEYVISGGQLTGAFRIVWRSPEVLASFRAEPELKGKDPTRCRETIGLIIEIMKGGTFSAISLETGQSLFEIKTGEDSAVPDIFIGTHTFVGWLELINRRLGLHLVYPDNVDDEIFDATEFAAMALQEGEVKVSTAQGIGHFELNKQTSKNLIEAWKTYGPLVLMVKDWKTVTISGQELSLGPSETHIENTLPVRTIADLEQALKKLPKNGKLLIEYRCERIVHRYLNWLPESSGATNGVAAS